MNKHVINLEVPEINVVLEALANMPFKQVYQLINNIHTQIEEHKKDAGLSPDDYGNAVE